MCEPQLLMQGAEGKLYLGEFNGQKCLIKERFQKKYRLIELDNQLTKERIRAESRTVSRCEAANIRVPKIYNADIKERKIYMEYFDKAITAKNYISDVLPKHENFSKSLEKLGKEIGSTIGKMHIKDIIHGDLTTSNILLNPKGNDDDFDLIMIDFGLSRFSRTAEDKGVDLYVLERALLSSHSGIPNLFSIILESYKKEHNQEGCENVIQKYLEVRERGRKRTMVG